MRYRLTALCAFDDNLVQSAGDFWVKPLTGSIIVRNRYSEYVRVWFFFIRRAATCSDVLRGFSAAPFTRQKGADRLLP